MKLSIIVPAHNEADNIAGLIKKIETAVDIPHELIIVNDHSQDNTADLVKSLFKEYANLKLIENTLEKGFANTVRTGFNTAKNEVVIPIMGDLCDDLLTVKKMFEKINNGFDVVCGARYLKGGARIGGSKFKAFLSGFAGRSLYWLLGIPTHDIANAFKMYKKKILEGMDLQSKGFEISMEIPLKAYYAGFKITEVPTTWHERTKGKSNFKIFKLLPAYFKLYIWAVWMRIIRLLPLYHMVQGRNDTPKNNILVFRNDRFGEFLLNIPAFRAIKQSFPDSKLSVAVNSNVKELAQTIEYIDELIEWNGQKHSLNDKIKFIRLLKKKHFDIAVMLNPAKEFNILTYLAGIPIRAGYDKKWGFLLNYKIKDNKFLGQKHEIDYNLELVSLIGAKTHDKSLSLTIKSPHNLPFIKEGDCENFIVIHPWTSDPIKQWPIENFTALAKKIAGELKIRIFIVGAGIEAEKNPGYFENLAEDLITDITGKTSLIELAYILKKSKLLISPDSGPMHLACAVHTPVIALFRNDIQGKTAKRWGPWGENNIVIEKPNLKDITVDEVFNKVKELIK